MRQRLNDSLLIAPKVTEGASLALPPIPPPSMLLHSTVSDDAGCVLRKAKNWPKPCNIEGRKGGVKSMLILKCCPSTFGQDCR